MDSREILRKVGSMQQVASVRPVTYTQGRSRGMAAFEIANGPLRLTAMADKALDVAELSYRGVNMGFLAKPGLQGRNQYDTRGQEALRSIMGGFFFTAGFENICAPCVVDGREYPMHGRIRTTPAEDLSSRQYWQGDDYILGVSGRMREAELFGENLTLTRSIRTVLGSSSFTLVDRIVNEGFRDEPMMLLYHINIGYPFLDEGTRLLMATRSVTPRDEAAAGHEDRWDVMDAPRDGEAEYVFIHEPIPRDGRCVVGVVSDRLGLGLRIEYPADTLPRFMEWKSLASGDYVIGLEPANSSVFGRAFHEEEGTVHRLAPFAEERNVIEFTILDGPDELAALEAEVASIRAAAGM